MANVFTLGENFSTSAQSCLLFGTAVGGAGFLLFRLAAGCAVIAFGSAKRGGWDDGECKGSKENLNSFHDDFGVNITCCLFDEATDDLK